METVTSLEDFHQMVLFYTMDTVIPEWASHVAVDKDGEIYIYRVHPVTDNISWRNPPSIRGKVVPAYCQIKNGTPCILKIPNHISWRDCVWKW